MKTMYVMIGLPGCGKSTWANQWCGVKVVSSDAIREELFGDASIQGNPAKVFEEVYKRLREAMTEGEDVIFDATNIDKKRKQAIQLCNEMNYSCVAIYFEVSPEICIKRQESRDRKVPSEVIQRMAKKLVKPSQEEGWTEIEKVYY